jgi:GntR family carbon starvation induced transcriptional regulator
VNDSHETSVTSLTSQVYARLRKDILTGTLKPGQKLRIEELKEQHGSGASPLREALSLLKSDFLVERVDQRGFYVAAVSRRNFDELLNTRCWLEAHALREAIKNGGRAWEEAIVLAAYHASHTPRSDAFDRLVENDVWETHHKSYHQALLAACGSQLLTRFCDQMYDLNIRYRRLAGPSQSEKRDINAEHAAIMEATLVRDADSAVGLLIDHYRRTGSRLSKTLL